MTRSLERAKRRISRALDQQQSLSRRLQSAIERTESLQTFRDQSLQLADRLRAESAEWVSTHQRDCLKRPAVAWSRPAGEMAAADRPRVSSRLWRPVLAASLLLAILCSVAWQLVVRESAEAPLANLSVDPSAVATSAIAQEPPAEQLASLSIPQQDLPSVSEVSSTSAVLPEQSSVDLAESSAVQDSTARQVLSDPRKQLLMLAVIKSTLGAIQIANANLSERLVSGSLDELNRQAGQGGADDNVEPLPGVADAKSLEQIALMRDILRTTDYLVQMFPRQAIRLVGSELD